MAGTLDYVQKGEAITAEKWNALVERINALEQRPSFGFGVSRRPKGGGEKLVLVAVLGWGWNPSGPSLVWSQDSNGVYYTTRARLVDETTLQRGTQDVTAYLMDSPRQYGFRNTSSSTWYNRWAIEREGRLELIDFQWVFSNTTYEGSEFIGIEPGVPYKITNEGCCYLGVANNGKADKLRASGQTIYFSGQFVVGSSSLDVVSGKEIKIRSHTVRVATPDGGSVDIKVLGDS